jgi:hypothetical protein
MVHMHAGSDGGDSGVGRHDADCGDGAVMVVVMIIKVVLGALRNMTEFPIHPNLAIATHRLNPFTSAPPTTHKRPVP